MEYEFVILDRSHPDSGKRIFLEGERLTCDEAAKKLVKALFPKLNPTEIDLKLRNATEEFDATRSLFSYKLRSEVRAFSTAFYCFLASGAAWFSIFVCGFASPP